MPSPPTSPGPLPQRPMSAMIRPAQRSSSRMSMSSKVGGSRASDEDARTSVKVGQYRPPGCLKPRVPLHQPLECRPIANTSILCQLCASGPRYILPTQVSTSSLSDFKNKWSMSCRTPLWPSMRPRAGRSSFSTASSRPKLIRQVYGTTWRSA